MKTIRLFISILTSFACTFMAVSTARAAATASDTACNDTGGNGTTGGSGFAAWVVNIGSGGGTYTTSDSTINGNGCGTAWGIFSGSSAVLTESKRSFASSATLSVGQQITADLHNGGVNSGSEGLSLYNSSGNAVFEMFFSSGSSTWSINDSTGAHAASPSIPYAGSGCRAVFTLTGATTYSLTVKEPGTGTQTTYGPYTGTLASPSGGQAITTLRFYTFNIGSGQNLQFNNIGASCPNTLAFTSQPASETVATNDTALFSADTFGDSVTHQWQSSSNSGLSWSNISGATNTISLTATNYESGFSVAATSANSGFQYRVIATDACGNTITSAVATLTLSAVTAPVITAQPTNTTVCSGSPATFSVTASGTSPGYNWFQQSNAGWGGSSAWSVTASNAGSGVFLGTSTNNNSTASSFCTGFGNNDIDSPITGNALGMFGPVIKVSRTFPSALSAGQWFSIDMDNGSVDTGVQNGFSLHTSPGAGNGVLFSFYFLGGQSNYKIFDGTGEHDTGIRFTRTGLRVQILVGSAVGGTNTYSLFVLTNQCSASSNITNVFSGSFETNGAPGSVLLFNNDGAGGSANDLFFNNLLAGAAYDNADNYSARNWANGGNGGDLPITGANGSSYTTNAQASGTYYVIVTNAAAAVVSSTAMLTVNPTPNLSLSETDVTCNGGSNGSVQATFSGGTGTLQVNIDGGAFSAQSSPYTFTGLGSGSHTVSVQGTTGCSSNLTIVVNQPSAVTIFSTSKQDNTVCGGNAGSITVTASGGTGALQYSDNGGGTYQASNQFTGLVSGAYSIVVKDANGCTSSATPVTINDPNGPSFTFSQANETCNGQSIGSITVTASGGSGSGYTYSKDNGATFQAGNQFTGLAAGSYTVVVKDGNGCTSGGQIVTITQPSVVTFTTSQTNETCNGQSIGSITVTPSGGSGSGYTYSMDNGVTFQAGNQFTGLSAGTYQIVVKDGNGCLSSAVPVTITQPSALSCSVSPSVVTNCAGSSQVFTVSPSGGTPGYTYSWSGPNSFSATGSSATNNNLQPASAGTYTVTVTDANGCQSTCTATLTVNVAPSITTQPTNSAACMGSPASFSVTATGSPLNYVWRKLGSGWGGGGWSFANSGTASSEFIGSSTDNDSGDTASNGGNDINTSGKSWGLFNNGGVADVQRPLNTPLAVGQTFSIDMDNGNIQSGGTVGFGLQNTSNSNNRLEVFFAGGNPDYTVSDNAGSNDSSIGFTRTGIRCQITLTGTDTYSITIIRFAGSVSAQTNTLTGTLKGTAGTVIDRLRLFNANAGDCGFGCNDNTLYFNNVSFGCNDDNAGNYASWTAGSDLGQGPLADGGDISGATTATLAINPASNADAGSYDVFVTNSCGVAISSNATLTVNANPGQYSVGGGGAYCSGGSGVSVTLSGSDAGVNYQLELNGNPTGSPVTGTGGALTFSNQTAAGTYTVVAVNATSGCTATMTGNASVTINPSPSCTVTPPSAAICANGSQTFTVNPSGGTPGYTYLWSDGSTGTSITTNAAGTYSVTVTDSNGCTSACNATLMVNPTPSCTVTPPSAAICAGGSQTFTVNPSGGTPGYTFLWSDGSTGTSITTNATGTYSVTVTDSNGCTSSCSAMLTVNPLPSAPTAGNNGPICAGTTLDLSASALAGATYSWTGPNGFASSQQDPSITNATTAASGTYLVTVTDSNGCTSAAGSTTATVNANPPVPTAGNNGPIVEGSTLNLTASTVANTTYSWTGPNGFTSADQNPSISNATSAASGTYLVTVTDSNGCTAVGSTTVLVTALQITSITTQGSDILITWATTGGTTNAVQATPGNPGYNTNFVDISAPLLILGSGDTSTNYLDAGAATNSPAKFYRIRLVP